MEIPSLKDVVEASDEYSSSFNANDPQFSSRSDSESFSIDGNEG